MEFRMLEFCHELLPGRRPARPPPTARLGPARRRYAYIRAAVGAGAATVELGAPRTPLAAPAPTPSLPAELLRLLLLRDRAAPRGEARPLRHDAPLRPGLGRHHRHRAPDVPERVGDVRVARQLRPRPAHCPPVRAAGSDARRHRRAAEARGGGAPGLHHVVLPDLDVHRLPAERRLPLPVRRPREVRTRLPPAI